MKPEKKPLSLPCTVCGQPAFFSVGWIVPTRKDAHAETADTRPACSQKCALEVVTP